MKKKVNNNNEIIINSAYSFAPGTGYIYKITSTFKNNISIIKHFSWADWENNFILEKKYKINGKSNFQNLIKAIINSDRSKSYFYLYFSGMKQEIDISNVEEWQKNFIIFCLGGNEETKECYGKPFLSFDYNNLKKIFNTNDIFSLVETYEELLSYFDDDPSKINISAILKKYKLLEFDNFEKLLRKLINLRENEIEEERIQIQNKKKNLPEAIKKYDRFFKTHKHKIKIEYPTGGGAIGRGIGKFIAERSVIFFIDYYFRKNKKLPKGEFNISYFSWDSRDIVKKYEDFKGKEDRKVVLL